MTIKPIGSGIVSNADSQQSGTQSFIDSAIKLVEAYDNNSLSLDEIERHSLESIELWKDLPNLSVRRECLCYLLSIEIVHIQIEVIKQLKALFGQVSFIKEVHENVGIELFKIEEILSGIIEAKCHLERYNFLDLYCDLYQEVLEHLWLLPYFERGNACSTALELNRDLILSRQDRWQALVNKAKREERLEWFIPSNLTKSIARLFTPLPFPIAGEIKKVREVIIHSTIISSLFFEHLADLYRQEEDYHRAIQHVEWRIRMLNRQAFPGGVLSNQIEVLSDQLEILHQIMLLHAKLCAWFGRVNLFDESVKHGKIAVQLSKQVGDDQRTYINLKGLGAQYLLREKYTEALIYYLEALDNISGIGDALEEIRLLHTIGGLYGFANQKDKAIQTFEKALELIEAQQQKEKEELNRDESSEAINEQRNRHPYISFSPFPKDLSLGAGLIHERLSTLYMDMGNYRDALFHANRALEIVESYSQLLAYENDWIHNKIGALTTLGSVYVGLGDYKRGLDFQLQALEALKNSRSTEKQYQVYMNLGTAHAGLENDQEAIGWFENALKVSKSKSKREQCEALASLGNILAENELYADAIAHYLTVIEIDNDDLRKKVLMNLGVAYLGLGDFVAAERSLNQSLQLAKQNPDLYLQASCLLNLGAVYKEQGPLEKAKACFCESIAIYRSLEEKLGDNIQSQITLFQEQIRPFIPLEEILLKKGDVTRALEVTDQRRARALVGCLERKLPHEVSKELFSPISFESIQALAINLQTTFLIYSYSFDRYGADPFQIGVWVVSSQGEVQWVQLPKSEFNDKPKYPEEIFQAFPYINEVPKKGASPSKAFIEKLSRWHEIFITPIEKFLPQDPTETVTVIPDGFLAHVPFGAFKGKDGKYLIEKHPIRIAPSLKVLQLLHNFPKNFPDRSLLIFDPVTPDPKANKLQDTKAEVETCVLPFLDTSQNQLLSRQDATVSRVIKEIQKARWIYLACHGIVKEPVIDKPDPHSVFEGLFKLGVDDQHPKGYLHSQEIANLSLTSELVFTSACHSGRGSLKHEGSVGPNWSFFAAGALATVSTYWELPVTQLSKEMIKIFFTHLFGIGVDKLNKARALQKAILHGLEHAPNDPRQWAPFYFTGAEV
jgi:CHAT domain-containing protein/tetratricopeptide (TPR) repeat protein